MLSAAQMRAARGLLNWSQGELAEAAGLSLPTIKRMETKGTGDSAAKNVDAVQRALEAVGISFIPENGGGGRSGRPSGSPAGLPHPGRRLCRSTRARRPAGGCL